MKSTIFSAIFCVLAATGFGQNLIKNGTFDGNPSYKDWKIEVTQVANQQTGGNPGGWIWLNHNGGRTDPSASQEITGLKPGTIYRIAGDYKGGTNVHLHYRNKTANAFSVDIDGNSIKKMPLPPDLYKWTRFEATFTATKTSHTLKFRGEIDGTDGDVALDNVVMAPNTSEPAPNSYVVEMLGRRGVLTLSDAVDKNPKGVKISLYGTDGQTQREINLDGCYWNNGKLAYSGKLNLLGKERQIYLTLKPEGDNLLGRITEKDVFDPIYPIYATKYEKAKDRLPAKQTAAKQYDLVVVNVLQTYSGPWWNTIPVTQVDSKFKMVYVTYDPGKHIMSLYDVPNNPPFSDFDVSKHIVGNESVNRYITPEIASSDESVFAEGLLQMIYSLRMKYPSKKFAIKYTGHGAPYMSFERISYAAQNGFYPILAEVLGTKIEYLDWSTNCNASSLYNLKAQAPYANYIMANDLLWGGCFFEGMKGSEYPWKKYNEYMTQSGDTKANLKNYVAALKAWLNNPSKQECYAKGGDKYETPQQITLFDCRAVETLLNDPSLGLDKLETADAQSNLSPATYYKDGSWTYGDLKTYITNKNASKVSLFDKAIVEQANNRTSFTWKIPAQGINFAKK